MNHKPKYSFDMRLNRPTADRSCNRTGSTPSCFIVACSLFNGNFLAGVGDGGKDDAAIRPITELLDERVPVHDGSARHRYEPPWQTTAFIQQR